MSMFVNIKMKLCNYIVYINYYFIVCKSFFSFFFFMNDQYLYVLFENDFFLF